MGVTVEVDIRAFPMEISRQMLELGKALNMTLGVVSYNEAEIRLETLLQVLDDYHTLLLGEFQMKLTRQKHSVIRFITLHVNNPNLKTSVARDLLDFVHYFPVAERPYEKVLDDDDLT